ncbi:FAD-binding protein [Helicobacter jaachi]|uniref:FAD-binding protein n=1 Tax=Helicobacter jaachi TaxID=1677920 RepID=A0A4U8T870_9HELI|nr:FAD-binding protein [Helicobacter jaachi]TLD95758.1 FAD-binding protein [Helicobacter jaachi]
MSVDLGQYDVAIIGLGVAGSNLAALLEPHLKVIAIDKKDMQGDCFDRGFHKPCGGLLSQGAQKAFAMQGLNLPKSVLVSPQIFAINTIDFGYPYASYIQKCYVNMERHRFDLWLKSRIKAHISVFHRASFKAIKQNEQGLYEVHFTQRQNELISNYHCRAKLVVGADGAASHIRAFSYPNLKIKSFICIQEWYKEGNTPMLSCIFDKDLTKSYSWSMSKDDYFIFGGAYAHKDSQKMFNEQVARLKSIGFHFGKKIKRESCLVLQPTRWRDFPRGHSGVFLIGEAAGFVNASTLEGISGAMHSSRILAHILNTESMLDTDSIFTESTHAQIPNNALSPYDALNKWRKNLHTRYTKATRMLVLKTLVRSFMRYPFMFIPCLRRLILRLGVLSIRAGLREHTII